MIDHSISSYLNEPVQIWLKISRFSPRNQIDDCVFFNEILNNLKIIQKKMQAEVEFVHFQFLLLDQHLAFQQDISQLTKLHSSQHNVIEHVLVEFVYLHQNYVVRYLIEQQLNVHVHASCKSVSLLLLLCIYVLS